MSSAKAQQILNKILLIKQDNLFLKYIVKRIMSNGYRGWHISQHNRYDLDVITLILQTIYDTAGTNDFAIPSGDYAPNAPLPNDFQEFQEIVKQINSAMDRFTINSLKKNLFPELDRMGFLLRSKIGLGGATGRRVLHGKLSPSAVDLINAGMIERYKKFTDGIDKLFGNKISELAELISLSDYRNDLISIYEFMFILSDNNSDLDKIELLSSYRSLSKYEQNKVINLVKEYANPENFAGGSKTDLRDFHNWKNEAQQIMGLLKNTVYFEVDIGKSFRLNGGINGFYQKLNKRSAIPKRDYFRFHNVTKQDKFELHHIVPMSSARNKQEAKLVDDYRNLIYIHKTKHKLISRNNNRNVVLIIDPTKAIFSDFENKESIKAKNDVDALYTKEQNKLIKMSEHNKGLLKSIFEFE